MKIKKEKTIKTAIDKKVIDKPKKKKVAILGTSNSLELCPFDDDSFEFWALADMNVPKYHRWFEMHEEEKVFNHVSRFSEFNFVEHLKSRNCPVYMQKHFEQIPNSVEYPINDIIKYFNNDYLTNTISYEIAMAIYEGYKEIHLYGVNMAVSTEYGFEKPSCEYWVGVARGMGIKVYIPKESDLLRATHLYGYQKILDKFSYIVNQKISDNQAKLNNYYQQQADRNIEINVYDNVLAYIEKINGSEEDKKLYTAKRDEAMGHLKGIQDSIQAFSGSIDTLKYLKTYME